MAPKRASDCRKACAAAAGSVPDLYKPPLPLLSSTISASAAPGARVSAEVSSTHTQRSASKRVEGRAPLPPAFAGATMVPPGLPDPQPSEAAWPWRTAEVDWDPESMVTGQARLTKQRRGKGQRPCTRCQIEGCTSRLPLRTYFQRQHICESHFKALSITDASGRVWRFCQQCTRPHPLDAFEGEKRSCRASLDRRRDRRVQRVAGSAPTADGSEGSASGTGSASDGLTAVPMTASDGLTAVPMTASDGLTAVPATANDGPTDAPATASVETMTGNHGSSGSLRVEGGESQEGPRLLSTLAPNRHAAAPATVAPPVQWSAGCNPFVGSAYRLHPAALASLVPGPGPLEPFSAAADAPLAAAAVPAEAVSLAAAPAPAAAAAAEAAAATTARLAEQDEELMEWLGDLSFLHSADVDSLLAMDADDLAKAFLSIGTLPQLSHMGPRSICVGDGASGGASSKTATAAVAAVGAAGASQPPTGAPALQQAAPLTQQAQVGYLNPAAVQLAAADALDLLDVDILPSDFVPQLEEVRVGLKLPDFTPEQLPPGLRADLLHSLQLPNTTPALASIRAGCVYLTITALVGTLERRRLESPGAAAVALAHLAGRGCQVACGRCLLQVGSSAALLVPPPSSADSPRPSLLVSLPQLGSISASAGAAAAAMPPAVEPLLPLATTVSTAGGRLRLHCTRALLQGGSGAGGSAPLTLHCRCNGRHVPVSLTVVGEPEPAEPDSAGNEDADEGAQGVAGVATAADGAIGDVEMEACVPAAAGEEDEECEEGGTGPCTTPSAWQSGWGLYEFEVSAGSLLGQATPVLVLSDSQAAAAAELACLPRGARSATLLHLVAMVLRHLEQKQQGGRQGREGAGLPSQDRISAAAAHLLVLAERACWPAVARLLAPAVGAAKATVLDAAGSSKSKMGGAVGQPAVKASVPRSGGGGRYREGAARQAGGAAMKGRLFPPVALVAISLSVAAGLLGLGVWLLATSLP